jgi:endonuclease YncB( thermonuclease family)
MGVCTSVEVQVEEAKPFGLAGLATDALVTRVIDGDTVELRVDIPLTYFHAAAPPCLRHTALVKGRLLGIDAAEKNTPAGRVAKRLLEEYLATRGNRVHAVFSKRADKFAGRFLVELYEDKTCAMGINRKWVGVVDPTVGLLVQAYDGRTKHPF